MARTAVRNVKAERRASGRSETIDDLVPVEEPLEIRLRFGPEGMREERTLSITMRTPGNDFELAAGFLFTEGVVRSIDDILSIKYCESVKPEEAGNVVRADVSHQVRLDWSRLQRNFYVSSSCGVCGKSSMESVIAQSRPIEEKGTFYPSSLLMNLPGKLRSAQRIFDHTGSLHASGLFDASGKLLLSYEDVGRHNALDKLIGRAVMERMTPLTNCLILVSGRTSFELVQKAVMAGAPVLAAVGAPSSLAVDLARSSGLTLIGFLRDGRFNIYSNPERITPAGPL